MLVFEWYFIMVDLRQLDGCRVLVELDVGGRRVTLAGLGLYEVVQGFNCLRIEVKQPSGPMSIILREGVWEGTVEPLPSGEYRITIGAESPQG